MAFIVDVFSRMVVGWKASTSLKSGLAIDALEMAIWSRQRAQVNLENLVHHSDRGVQYLSIRYSDRLASNEIMTSVGSKGDSYDNALAESFNGLYKWELIYRQGPWENLNNVKYATLEYVDWFNNRRLHSQINDGPRYLTPTEAENQYIITTNRDKSRFLYKTSGHQTRGDSFHSDRERSLGSLIAHFQNWT